MTIPESTGAESETLSWQSIMQSAISNVDAHTILVMCSVPLDSVVFPSDESRQAAMSFYVNSKAECSFMVCYENCNVSPTCNFLLF